MSEIGYIWVGPLEHNGEYQRDLLKRRGVTRIFEDIGTGSTRQTRPELTTVLNSIRPDDTLVTWRLDRLAGTLAQVLSLIDLLAERGVGVRSLTEQLDTSGSQGEALRGFVHACVELDRSLNRERTMVGVYAARSRGRVGGRPRALSETNVERVAMLHDQGASVREIAQQLGTSRATIYRALEARQHDDDAEASPEATQLRIAAPTFDLGSHSPRQV